MADLSGHTLGRYQVLERLGRGGMADVYRAYHSGLDRYVAIKVMHSHLSEDSDFISRFQREAKSVAALKHPNIVQVFDFDTQDNVHFMVMEYIEGGRTLKELLSELALRGERLPLRTVFEMTTKLADALDYAHQRGMIHRDIKPSNILLNEAGQPVLSDFGIARLIGQTALTGSGAMIGTPAYMSPEQGRGEKADERSDIYALGIILYEMLTGQPPYDADTPYGVILKHINDPLVPPRSRVEGLPASAERVVLKCLSKAPEDRYETAAALRSAALEAVEDIAADTMVSATTPPSGTTLPGTRVVPSEENPETIAVTKAPSSAPRPRRVPWLPIAAVIGALIVIGIIALLIASAGGDRTAGDQDNAAAGLAEPGRDEAGEAQGAGPEEEPESPEVRALLDDAYIEWENGHLDESFDLFAQVLETDPDNPEALVSQGLIRMEQNASDEAAAILTQAEAVAPDHYYVQYGVGMLHTRIEGYYDPAAAITAFGLAAARCGDDTYICVESLVELSQLQAWNNGDYRAAIESLNRAYEYEMEMYQITSVLVSRADIYYYGLGDVEAALADYDEAYARGNQDSWILEGAVSIAAETEQYDRAFAYYDQLLRDHGGDPRYLVGRGYVQRLVGDYDAARASAERALALDESLIGAHYLLGLVLLDIGNAEDAFAELELVYDAGHEALEDYWLGPFPFFRWEWGHDIRYDLARTAYEMGDTEDALHFLDELIGEDPWWALPFMLKGQILAEGGDLAGARENYTIARERTDDPDLQDEIDQRLVDLTG